MTTNQRKRIRASIKISTLFAYDRLDSKSRKLVKKSRDFYKRQRELCREFKDLNGVEYEDDFWDLTFELKELII